MIHGTTTVLASDWHADGTPTILLGANGPETADCTQVLQDQGYELQQVNGTTEFIEAFQTICSAPRSGRTLELVVLAFASPRWANEAMLEYIRQRDWAMPVVVVTRRGEVTNLTELSRLGVTAALHEPEVAKPLGRLVAGLGPHPRVPVARRSAPRGARDPSGRRARPPRQRPAHNDAGRPAVSIVAAHHRRAHIIERDVTTPSDGGPATVARARPRERAAGS